MRDISIFELRSLMESYENMVQGDEPFSTKTLNDMKYFKDRVAYCKKYLKYLGRGSSRMSFLMPNGHVLKLAFNSKGLAQNQAECSDWYKNSLECFTTVYNTADDHTWCEVEAAVPCKTQDFPRLLNGMTFVEMCDFLVDMTRQRGYPNAFRYRYLNTPKERLKEIEEAMWDDPESHPLLYNLSEYIGNYGASENLVADFFNIKNWGIVNRDGEETLVVTDSGLNDDVWNDHYARKRSWD